MANSLTALLSSMKGRTVTQGWGAIVSLNRTKVNQLLAQQHIARFSNDSFLPSISGTVTLEGFETLELSGLILSEPRLSFVNATLKDSLARMTMGIVGGTVTRMSTAPGAPTRALSSFNISEQHQYIVEADIQLEKAAGGINQNSEVVLNIANGTNFSTNLIDGDSGPTQVGNFFQARFDRLPAQTKVYSLGLLDFNADELLAPRDFYILTQAAPGARELKADTYGDGAVVIFVRTRNNFYDGTLPSDEKDFPFLIPDDKAPGDGGSLYSGSLLIARNAVIHWYIAPSVRNQIGHGLSFDVEEVPETGEYRLQAVAGAYTVNPIDVVYEHGTETFHFKKSDLQFPFRSSLALVIGLNDHLALTWTGASRETFHYWDDIENWWDEHKDVEMDLSYELNITFDLVIDSTNNVLTFVQSDASTQTSSVTVVDKDQSLYDPLMDKAKLELKAILDGLLDTFKSISIPDINFFAINHLLFPEHNALLLEDAFLPGDLAMFGQIDPTLTSFKLDPLYVTIKTGDTLQFNIVELTLRAANVTWSVRNIDGSGAQGLINGQGLYSAPALGLLEDETTRNVVTASYVDSASGQTRTASALVIVVAQSISITPAMYAIDLRTQTGPVEFTASTLSGGTVTWTPLPADQGMLVAQGNHATYTPPSSTPAGGFLPVIIKAQDPAAQKKQSDDGKAVATAILMDKALLLDVTPAFHPGLAPKDSIKLTVLENGGQPQAGAVTWRVAVGDGTVDALGTFTAPDVITFPYSVVAAVLEVEQFTISGYCVVHLSEIAPRARWTKFKEFTIKEESGSPLLFDNGLQQVKLRVAVMVFDEEGKEAHLSPSELSSMCLIVAETGDELPYVGIEGVPPDSPEGEKWGVNTQENGYRYYPQNARANATIDDESRALDGDGKSLYVQSRSEISLRIAVKLTRADNAPFYSTDQDGSEARDNIISLTTKQSPAYNADAYDLRRARIEGGLDNDYVLNSVDYYYLELHEQLQKIKFVQIAFEGPASMVQWESRQFAEEMGSYTGYALPRSNVLRFEPLLINSIAPDSQPSTQVPLGSEAPDGTLLISLHRRKDFIFDANSDFEQPMHLRLIDEYGNLHKLRVQFKSPTDRNELVVVADN